MGEIARNGRVFEARFDTGFVELGTRRELFEREMLPKLAEALAGEEKVIVLADLPGSGKTTLLQLFLNLREILATQTQFFSGTHDLMAAAGNLIDICIRMYGGGVGATWYHTKGKGKKHRVESRDFTGAAEMAREGHYNCLLNDPDYLFQFLSGKNFWDRFDEIAEQCEDLEEEQRLLSGRERAPVTRKLNYLKKMGKVVIAAHREQEDAMADEKCLRTELANASSSEQKSKLAEEYLDKSLFASYSSEQHHCTLPPRVYHFNQHRIDRLFLYEYEKEKEHYRCPFYGACEWSRMKERVRTRKMGDPFYNKVFSPLAHLTYMCLIDDILQKRKNAADYCEPDQYAFEEYPNFHVTRSVGAGVLKKAGVVIQEEGGRHAPGVTQEEEAGPSLVEFSEEEKGELFASRQELNLLRHFKFYHFYDITKLAEDGEFPIEVYNFRKTLEGLESGTICAAVRTNGGGGGNEEGDGTLPREIELSLNEEGTWATRYLFFGLLRVPFLEADRPEKIFLVDATADELNVALDFRTRPGEVRWLRSDAFKGAPLGEFFALTKTMPVEKADEYIGDLCEVLKIIPEFKRPSVGICTKKKYLSQIRSISFDGGQLPHFYGGRGQNNFDAPEGRSSVTYGCAGLTPLDKFIIKLNWVNSDPPVLHRENILEQLRRTGVVGLQRIKKLGEDGAYFEAREKVIQKALEARQNAEGVHLMHRFRLLNHPERGHLLITHKGCWPPGVELGGELAFLRVLARCPDYALGDPTKEEFWYSYTAATRSADTNPTRQRMKHAQFLSFLAFMRRHFFT